MRIKLTGKHSAKVEEHKRETTPLECTVACHSRAKSDFLLVIVSHSSWEGKERVKDKEGRRKRQELETWKTEDDKEKRDSLREARRQK